MLACKEQPVLPSPVSPSPATVQGPFAPRLLALSRGNGCVHPVNLAMLGVVLVQSRALGRARKSSHTIPLSFAFPGSEMGLGAQESQGGGPVSGKERTPDSIRQRAECAVQPGADLAEEPRGSAWAGRRQLAFSSCFLIG